MGGHPYWYFIPYESDVQHALDTLRDREFKAGRYNPVIPFLEFGEGATRSATQGRRGVGWARAQHRA